MSDDKDDEVRGPSPTPRSDSAILLRKTGRWKVEDMDRFMRSLERELAEQEEKHRMQLTAIDVGALINTRESAELHRIDQSNPYWTPALQSVYAAVDREMAERERGDQLDIDLEAIRG